MAETLSLMLPLGTRMPGFSLRDAVSGRAVGDRDVAGTKGTVVMFICNHCPFVKHVVPEIGRVAADYMPRGIGFVAINPNDQAAYPQDGPEYMKELATSQRWPFPFLFDESQDVARAYRAACTPDFFAFDAQRLLVYRGRLDESRPNSPVEVTGRELRAALDAIAAGRAPAADQKPSVGCSIKWKPENAPA
jgi:thiol-disulfide isomerase/thioredoxin